MTTLRATRDEALARGSRVAVNDWFVVELGLGSGLRVFELAALVCSDLVLRDPAAVVVRRGKGSKHRVVRVGKRLREAAEQFLAWKRARGEDASDDAPAFLSSNTQRAMTTRALQLSFARSLKRAGLEHRGIHALRHTYATSLLRASGGNLRLVQRQLGHASLSTTQVYLGLFADDLKRAVENLYADLPGPPAGLLAGH